MSKGVYVFARRYQGIIGDGEHGRGSFSNDEKDTVREGLEERCVGVSYGTMRHDATFLHFDGQVLSRISVGRIRDTNRAGEYTREVELERMPADKPLPSELTDYLTKTLGFNLKR